MNIKEQLLIDDIGEEVEKLVYYAKKQCALFSYEKLKVKKLIIKLVKKGL